MSDFISGLSLYQASASFLFQFFLQNLQNQGYQIAVGIYQLEFMKISLILNFLFRNLIC